MRLISGSGLMKFRRELLARACAKGLFEKLAGLLTGGA